MVLHLFLIALKWPLFNTDYGFTDVIQTGEESTFYVLIPNITAKTQHSGTLLGAGTEASSELPISQAVAGNEQRNESKLYPWRLW